MAATDPHGSEAADLVIHRSDDGDATVLLLAGEIEMSSAPTLRDELDVLVGTTRRIVLDMREVEFLDSTGIGTIVGAQQLLANDFCQLSISHPSATVQRVLDLMGLTELLLAPDGLEPIGAPSGDD